MTKTKLFCLISGILALLALGAVPINFKDIASTNVVKTNDLALIDADLGGGSYATRTTVYKLILDKLSKAQATNALAMDGDAAKYLGFDGNGHALPSGVWVNDGSSVYVNTNGIINIGGIDGDHPTTNSVTSSMIIDPSIGIFWNLQLYDYGTNSDHTGLNILMQQAPGNVSNEGIYTVLYSKAGNNTQLTNNGIFWGDAGGIGVVGGGSGGMAGIGVSGESGFATRNIGTLGYAQGNDPSQTMIGLAGTVIGSFGTYGGTNVAAALWASKTADQDPDVETAMLFIDNNDSGFPLIVGRTNNGAKVFNVDADGSIHTAGSLTATNGVTVGGTLSLNGQSIETQLTNKVSKAGDTMTGALTVNVDGSSFRNLSITYSVGGANWIASSSGLAVPAGVCLLDSSVLSWSPVAWNGVDLALRCDAPNTLDQRNGTNPQQQSWYDTYTDAANFRNATWGWSKNANAFTLSTTNAGTALGTGGSIILAPLGAAALTIATNKSIVLAATTNQVVFGATNTAPVSSVAPTKWISVQVSGESTVYRLPLYE